jgi:uncharacterized protein (DUF58 family)
MNRRSVVARGRSVRPTRRGWAVLAVAVAVFALAVAFDRREGLIVAVFLASTLAAAVTFVAVRRERLDVSRRLPASVLGVGEDAEIVVDVGTRSWDPSIRRWRDTVPESFGGEPHGEADDLVRSAGGGSMRARYLVAPRRRGEYSLGPLIVTREDPFGLVAADRASVGRSEVVVTPRVFPLIRSELIQASGDGARHEHRMSSHPQVDELIAREYRAGDPMRRIHWRATARRGELMVRQEEQEVDPAVVLLLDTGSVTGESSVAPETFEHLVDLAASIAVHVLGDGFRLSLVESVPSDRSARGRFEPGQSADVLAALALVTPRETDPERPDIAGVAREALERTGASVPVVAVLSTAGLRAARRLAPLSRLADPAVAFVPDSPAAAAAAGVLRASGWLVGTVGPGRSVAEAWNAAMLLDPSPAVGVS